MGPICELEEKHGVDLGSGYKNDQACATFVSYIAQEQRELLASVLPKAKFFAVQADDSTDTGNVEEVFLVMYFDPHATDGKIHIHDQFLAVRQPTTANAAGLFECFTRALSLKYVQLASNDFMDHTQNILRKLFQIFCLETKRIFHPKQGLTSTHVSEIHV